LLYLWIVKINRGALLSIINIIIIIITISITSLKSGQCFGPRADQGTSLHS